jgi:hypothetical protein
MQLQVVIGSASHCGFYSAEVPITFTTGALLRSGSDLRALLHLILIGMVRAGHKKTPTL